MSTPSISSGSTIWQGDLLSGVGATTLDSSGLGRFNLDWKARAGSHGGWRTSPEELLAAAHSACFAMRLSHDLTENGTPPVRLHAAAEVAFVPGTGITGIHLHVVAEVSGVSTEDFRRIAESAALHCPLSRALAAIEVTLSASLAATRPVLAPGDSGTVGGPDRRQTDARQLQV